jgi:hypothetical protein
MGLQSIAVDCSLEGATRQAPLAVVIPVAAQQFAERAEVGVVIEQNGSACRARKTVTTSG